MSCDRSSRRTVRVTEDDLRLQLARSRVVVLTGIDTQTGERVTFSVRRKPARKLIGQIGRGELVSGQRLPSENDLAAEYGVARMTVRRAARELTERGLVRVVTGKGTFVV